MVIIKIYILCVKISSWLPFRETSFLKVSPDIPTTSAWRMNKPGK